jgi:protoporphyrinogen oxidase
MSTKPLVAVIGLGAAGCTAAHFLAASTTPSVRVHLLGEEFAGKSSTVLDGTTPIDSAASLLTDTYTLVNQLADALGLAGERQPFIPRLEMRHDSGSVGSFTLNDPRSLASYSLLTFEDKLRLAVELVHLLAATSIPGYDPMALADMLLLDSGKSAAEYVKATMGVHVLDNMARLIEGLWLQPLEGMSDAHIKSWLSRPTVPYSVFGKGLERLWSALVDQLKRNPDHNVTSGVRITHVASSGEGYAVTLRYPDGHSETEQVDAVVLALSSSDTLTVAGPLLSVAQRRILTAQQWVASVHGVFQVRAQRDIPPTHGGVFPVGPGTHPIAAVQLINHHKLAGAGGPLGAHANDTDLASIYASGDFSQTLLEIKDDDDVYKALHESAQNQLGDACYWLDAPPERNVALFKRPVAIPIPGPGSARDYVALEVSQLGRRLQLAGGWTQLPVPYSLESSARSGQKSAERLLRAL